jgi:hypothetical protein
MTGEVYRQIEALRHQKTKALRAIFKELFGEESTSSNHAHLFRRIAWRIQARAQGDLSQRARDRAAELASDVDLRLRAPRQFWRQLAETGEKESRRGERDPRLPEVGTTLQRHYQGRMIQVRVLEDGFEYDGKKYESLSSIASSVSGSRWNGYSFFRLNKKVKHA